MSTSTDTFVAFVDTLSSNLDGHAPRADELAARAYFSRSHFDRIVSAAAGETPARFRRRVLLERAAYRLLTSDASVLQIAIEAGYASNEAFTRAFRRAYGAAALAGHSYDFGVESGETIASMRSRLAEAGSIFLAQVRDVAEQGRLDETFVDAICEPPEVFTYGGMIAHVLTFAAHRRTLAIGALHSAGITDLGSGDPMGGRGRLVLRRSLARSDDGSRRTPADKRGYASRTVEPDARARAGRARPLRLVRRRSSSQPPRWDSGAPNRRGRRLPPLPDR
jgi:AraC-like DNA-binding protein